MAAVSIVRPGSGSKENFPELVSLDRVQQAIADQEAFKRLIPTDDILYFVAKQFPDKKNELFFIFAQIVQKIDPKGACDKFKVAAEGGHTRAKASLGSCYLEGQGVAKNVREAMRWLSEAANEGHERSQLNLGKIHELGEEDGIAQDFDVADYWYQRTEKEGNEKAQARAAECRRALQVKKNPGEQLFRKGYGLEKEGDFAGAFAVYQQAADKHNHSLALSKKSTFLLLGKEGVAPNKGLAYQGFWKLAEGGDLAAKFNCALMLEAGDGIRQEILRARSIYQELAGKGHKQAAERLQLLGSQPRTTPLRKGPIPTLEATYIAETPHVWEFDPAIKPKLKKDELFRLVPVPPSTTDWEKIQRLWAQFGDDSMELDGADAIVNHVTASSFTTRARLLQQRAGDSIFQGKFDKESEPKFRKEVLEAFKKRVSAYQDPVYEDITFVYGFHGTSQKAFPGICANGFVNLSSTDPGYYGSGVYFSDRAPYSLRYAKDKETGKLTGELLLSGIAMYAIHVVTGEDGLKFARQGAHPPFDGRIIPVKPAVGMSNAPCNKGDPCEATEIMVFESVQCIALYRLKIREKAPTLPLALPSAPATLSKATSKKDKPKK